MSLEIALATESEDFIRRMIASGGYEHASAVVADALQLLEDETLALEARRNSLIRSIDEALAETDATGGIPVEAVLADVMSAIHPRPERRDAAE